MPRMRPRVCHSATDVRMPPCAGTAPALTNRSLWSLFSLWPLCRDCLDRNLKEGSTVFGCQSTVKGSFNAASRSTPAVVQSKNSGPSIYHLSLDRATPEDLPTVLECNDAAHSCGPLGLNTNLDLVGSVGGDRQLSRCGMNRSWHDGYYPRGYRSACRRRRR